jgi:S1-C subfamily serine protease
MKKVTLYSSSARTKKSAGRSAAPEVAVATPSSSERPIPEPRSRAERWQAFGASHKRAAIVAAIAIAVVALAAVRYAMPPPPAPLTQQDIDAAVLHTLETVPLPSRAAKAYEAVRRSVVRVHGSGYEHDKEGHVMQGVGTGVVIVDTGIILTNLHVIAGADKIEVEFDDGTESEAAVIGMRPEHDLAVLQAKKLPDDLPAATLRSTADLVPGDDVVAIGYPFGIGPSASAGVISGLRREYRSLKGERVLTNLIQFDAAVNPGNSGGPLVTMDGEVVGIVTAILNPTEQKVFIGIGFAVPIENAASAIGMSPF